MEKKTTLALEFALQFFDKQLPKDILRDATQKAKCDIEALFPLNHVDPNRKDKRVELWQELDHLSPKAILQLRTALIIFANFHVPFSALIKKASPDYDECAINAEIATFRDFCKNHNFIFGETRRLLEREIKTREVTVKVNRKEYNPRLGPYKIEYSIDGTIKLYRDFLKSTKAIDLSKTYPNIIASFLFLLRNNLRLDIEKGRNISDLPFRALIFIVFMLLCSANKNKKASARLTARLMNEYFSHNAFIDSKEMTENDILNQWKNSTYKGEFLRNKSPLDILK